MISHPDVRSEFGDEICRAELHLRLDFLQMVHISRIMRARLAPYAEIDCGFRGEEDAIVFLVPSDLDDAIIRYTGAHGDTGTNHTCVDELLDKVIISRPGSCSLFTLNHDLYVERIYCEQKRELTLPGIPRRGMLAQGRHRCPLKPEDLITLLPGQECEATLQADLDRGGPFYLKLHGSHNWQDAEGKRRMIVGASKAADIESQELLKTYSEIFASALSEGSTRLLVIGYGFRDHHINKAIATACCETGLQVHVVSPLKPEWLRKTVQEQGHGEIWDGLHGFYQYDFSQIFPRRPSVSGAQDATQGAMELYRGFFGENAPPC